MMAAMAPATSRSSGGRSRPPGNEVCRAPLTVPELEPVELDGLADHHGWSEVAATGSAIAADAEGVSFARSTITGVRFTGAQLHRLDLADVTVANCDFAGATLSEASFTRVAFVSCRLEGADLGGASLVDVRFTDCQMDELGLRLARTERLAVTGGSAVNIDLYRAWVRASRWHDVDLTGAQLSGAEMERARLHGSTVAEVRGGRALKGTVISPDQELAVGRALLADFGIAVEPDDRR